jgi:hypothetical protein
VDASGVIVDSARTTASTETIRQIVGTAGTYYLHIYGSANPGTAGRNTGNAYDLWWRDTLDDDEYEENDTLATAADISRNKWLSETPEGVAKQYDVDWYRIPVTTVATDAPRLAVTCQFNHAEGDIDIAIYSATARLVDSTTAQSTETIHATLEKGTYYLAVYGHGAAGNKGNTYDLWWNPQVDDDKYETGVARPNSSNGSDGWAYDPGYDWRGVWLSTIDGRGRVMDDDWYKIEVTDHNQPVVVTCRFVHAEGDLQLVVNNLDQSFEVISTGSGDGEALSFSAPSNGSYYIGVRPAHFSIPYPYTEAPHGNYYDLRWTN